jgi:hypothetical protein
MYSVIERRGKIILMKNNFKYKQNESYRFASKSIHNQTTLFVEATTSKGTRLSIM